MRGWERAGSGFDSPAAMRSVDKKPVGQSTTRSTLVSHTRPRRASQESPPSVPTAPCTRNSRIPFPPPRGALWSLTSTVQPFPCTTVANQPHKTAAGDEADRNSRRAAHAAQRLPRARASGRREPIHVAAAGRRFGQHLAEAGRTLAVSLDTYYKLWFWCYGRFKEQICIVALLRQAWRFLALGCGATGKC